MRHMPIFAERLLRDGNFRRAASLRAGMVANVFYALFRAVEGIIYSSPWLAASAFYFLVLGILRAYICRSAILSRRENGSRKRELSCCRNVALSLFLLLIPMACSMYYTIFDNPTVSYPGHTIYASALYTFCMVISAAVNLAKRDTQSSLGAPVLSLIAAMMSLLGLQNALISEFSNGNESFRTIMNLLLAIAVILISTVSAVGMLIHLSELGREVRREQIGK